MAGYVRLKPKSNNADSNSSLTRVIGGGLKNVAQLPFQALEFLTQPDTTYETEYDNGQHGEQPRFKPSEILEENVYKPILGNTAPQGMIEQGAQTLVELLALNPTALGASLGKSASAIHKALKTGGKVAATKLAVKELIKNPVLQQELASATGMTAGRGVGKAVGGPVGEAIGGLAGGVGGRYLQDRLAKGLPLTHGERLEDVLEVTEPLKKGLYAKAEEAGKKINVNANPLKEKIQKYQTETKNKLTPEPWQAEKNQQLGKDLKAVQRQLNPEQTTPGILFNAENLHEIDKNINDAIGKASDPEVYKKVSAIIKQQMEETGALNPHWYETLKDAKELHKLANFESGITRAFKRAGEIGDNFSVKNVKVFKELNKLIPSAKGKLLAAAGLKALGVKLPVSMPILFGVSGLKQGARLYDDFIRNQGLRDFINSSPKFADANKKLLDAVSKLSPSASLSDIKGGALKSALSNFNAIAKDYEHKESKQAPKEEGGFIRLKPKY